ncbi:Hypothetical predicted protein [Cloeon dipterum]|uniref:Uncharacterized protein n=1 Tax=Cloeon dipterum TaxID=197152 RepID=A0A8S1DL52_9INSE|nr:Hypothetical predicted protein [Cloeon dipterum]
MRFVFLLFLCGLTTQQTFADLRNLESYECRKDGVCYLSEFDWYLNAFADSYLCLPENRADGVRPEKDIGSALPGPQQLTKMEDTRTKFHDLVQSVKSIIVTLGPMIKKVARPIFMKIVLPALKEVSLRLVVRIGVTLALAAVFILGSALLVTPFCIATPLCPIVTSIFIYASGYVLANPILLNIIIVIIIKIIQMLASILGIPI